MQLGSTDCLVLLTNNSNSARNPSLQWCFSSLKNKKSYYFFFFYTEKKILLLFNKKLLTLKKWGEAKGQKQKSDARFCIFFLFN